MSSTWNTKGFVIGDKVRVVKDHYGFSGAWVTTGEYLVTSLERDGYQGNYNVRLSDGKWANHDHLVKVTTTEGEPIEFEDIKVGDKITQTRTFSNGESAVRTGVVVRTGSGYIVTSQFTFYEGISEGTYTLLGRPKPALPSEDGSTIIATVGGRENQTLVKNGARWFSITGWGWHRVDEITDWVLAKVVAQD